MAIEGHMEVKKHAIRQTQDGWVVSFVIHPNDIKGDFAAAPLGTRFMLGYAEVTDEPNNAPASADPKASPTPLGAGAERMRKEVVPDTQPALRSATSSIPGMQQQRSDNATPPANLERRGQVAKERYRNAPPWTKDAMRASILCGDEKFQKWLQEHAPIYVAYITDTPETLAARTVRGLIGAKSSRNEIATDEDVRNRFIALEQQYRIENGLAAEVRGE